MDITPFGDSSISRHVNSIPSRIANDVYKYGNEGSICNNSVVASQRTSFDDMEAIVSCDAITLSDDGMRDLIELQTEVFSIGFVKKLPKITFVVLHKAQVKVMLGRS